jgi:hypothetical protein
MSYRKEADTESLKARLRAVLPDYAPLNEWDGDTPGVYKAIDTTGSVWLVTWHKPYTDVNGVFWRKRSKRLVLKPDEGEMAPTARRRVRRDPFAGSLD